jgi:hypothetical protein
MFPFVIRLVALSTETLGMMRSIRVTGRGSLYIRLFGSLWFCGVIGSIALMFIILISVTSLETLNKLTPVVPAIQNIEQDIELDLADLNH